MAENDAHGTFVGTWANGKNMTPTDVLVFKVRVIRKTLIQTT
jgi:hypothetical protein